MTRPLTICDLEVQRSGTDMRARAVERYLGQNSEAEPSQSSNTDLFAQQPFQGSAWRNSRE